MDSGSDPPLRSDSEQTLIKLTERERDSFIFSTQSASCTSITEGELILFWDRDTGLVEMNNIIKIIVLFGKHHIHQAKCMLTVPMVDYFPLI